MNIRQFLMDQSYDCAEEFVSDPRTLAHLPPMNLWQLAFLREVLANAHARGRTEGICFAAAQTVAKRPSPSDSTAAPLPTRPAPHA